MSRTRLLSNGIIVVSAVIVGVLLYTTIHGQDNQRSLELKNGKQVAVLGKYIKTLQDQLKLLGAKPIPAPIVVTQVLPTTTIPRPVTTRRTAPTTRATQPPPPPSAPSATTCTTLPVVGKCKPGKP